MFCRGNVFDSTQFVTNSKPTTTIQYTQNAVDLKKIEDFRNCYY